MKSIIFLFALILSFVATAQDGSLDCLTRRQKEEIYKLVKINDLLETRKTQCDTIILTLEEQNRILGKKKDNCLLLGLPLMLVFNATVFAWLMSSRSDSI